MVSQAQLRYMGGEGRSIGIVACWETNEGGGWMLKLQPRLLANYPVRTTLYSKHSA